ncbi:anillin isoform X1 [Leptopilina heterotoma]|uniref:anillin isoform X1 n=1 Tax=Leptopilina heterotoma TaxID=63436 RepID=UPI001CA81747|nr:anillin isoform X1 [Leptopilina heterotoma]
MDPFTQRMLERAKARREKLDTQLSNAGHDVKRRRSPLKDANAILAKVPAITQKITAKSPKKVMSSSPSSKSSSPSVSPLKAMRKSPLKIPIETKENGESLPPISVKSKLQRLGKLYSEDDRELSSPIHRTEEKFTANDDDDEDSVEFKSAKSGARLNRLAALASTINNWEDDLSHPTLVKPTVSKAEKIQAKLNQQVKNAEPQPGTSGTQKNTTRQLKWDKVVLDSLEAQGFSRTKRNSRLVYDYKDCSQGAKNNGQGGNNSPRKRNEALPEVIGTMEKQDVRVNTSRMNSSSKFSTTSSVASSVGSPSGSSRFNENKVRTTPEKKITPAHQTSNVGNNCNNTRGISKYDYSGSPKSSIKQSPGSVLSKASMFESRTNSNFVKAKDPAEMSLSERKALFERNKGEALIPKAPLTMSVPTKKLMEKEKHTADSCQKTETSVKKVSNQRNVYEQGVTQELENNILQSIQSERQKELEMLRSRFTRSKEVPTVAVGCALRTSESSEGKSNSPKNSPICPVKPTPAPQDFVPPPPPLPKNSDRRSSPLKNSPFKRQVVRGSVQSNQPRIVDDIKRVKVCAPKPGNLYPDLTGIEESTTDSETEFTVGSTEPETATLEEPTETETEADYYVEDETEDDSDDDEECEDIYNTSLGRSILDVVNQQSALNKKRTIYPDMDSSTSDISVLEEMDEYLDECLALQGNQEGPTPPKLNRGGKSPSATSTSFKYTQGNTYRSPIKINSPSMAQQKKEPYIVEGENCVPLMHSVSFYRRQQSQTPKTPVRLISRIPDGNDSPGSPPIDDKQEALLVQEKVKRLLEEVCKQQTTIGQASQALNLCNSTVEFSGSREQVEGERLLLLATHRRQAALHEIQRLKVEGTLRPVVPGAPEIQENGSLTVSAITLPIKRENVRNLDADTRLHFLCLVRHMENIVSTPVIQVEPGDSCIRFPSTLKIEDLYSDFKITIEVYSLQTRAEVLPHEIKYHIHNNSSSSGSKKPGGKTPKKYLKHESKLIMPAVQSPAGPSAVRSPAFSLAGYVVFSLREVHRQQFTLNKVPSNSPLEGKLQMHVSCELSVAIEHRGFLTMFEDVSGFGAWHRRWCLLKGDTISYWKYPDDERKKTPIGSLDLQGIATTSVGLVSRDICARPNTFLLETMRRAQSGDVDSLIMVRNGSNTTVRHLLSADTKEDRLEWCAKLNKTINLIRAWGGSTPLS